MDRFARTQCWIFDLDNTLYPADCDLFAQINRRMGDFVARLLAIPFAHAERLRVSYYRRYGTTLCGLMREHGIDPDEFLDYVHDIDLAAVAEAPLLAAAIDALPGRKFVFTNGSRRHAENVAGKLGLLDRFEDVFDIDAAGYVPKPERAAYDSFLKAHGIAATRAAMFEDMPHNLETAHALGMATVLVTCPGFAHPAHGDIVPDAPPAHIHHVTDDLTDFLGRVGRVLDAPANPAQAPQDLSSNG